MSKEIKLRKFTVELESWGSKKGQYECSARFTQGGNDFTIHLDNELGQLLVSLCKGRIAEASAEMLEHLKIMAEEN